MVRVTPNMENWLVCFVFLFLRSLPSFASHSQYEVPYGNVLTEKIPHQNMNEIFNFISTHLLTAEEELRILKYEEHMQYYSDDGMAPFLLLYADRSMCYGIPAALGTMHYIVTSQHGSLHRFKIIKETTGKLRIYSHTHYHHLSPSLQCKRITNPIVTYNSATSKTCNLNIKCQPLELTARESDWSKITIATYNIWNMRNSSAGESHPKRIKRLIKAVSSFDIIGFQEVRSVSGDQSSYQIEQLRKGLPGYQYVYQPAMQFTPSKIHEEGVAILSRFPILSTDYILLPWNSSDPNDSHQRVCLHCAILSPAGVVVNVFVTHLSLDETAQKRSVIEIYHYMEQFFGPSILLGDLNSEPHSPPIRFLNGELFLDCVRTSRVYDVWSQLEYKDGETFSAIETNPVKRIDFMFLKNINGVCIESVSIIGKSKDPPLSDHYGLYTELMIERLL